VTPLAHLFEDHRNGPERSRRQHFEEWVRLVLKVEEPVQVESTMKSLMERDYSIHYHVWTQKEFLEFLYSVKDMLCFDVEVFLKNGLEMIIILRKLAAKPQGSGAKVA
jgi:hypothetical protein